MQCLALSSEMHLRLWAPMRHPPDPCGRAARICGPAWRPFWGRSHGAARYAPRRIVRSPPRSSVFEESSQTSEAGEGTAEGANRPWVGGTMKNWPAPSALRKRASACEGYDFVGWVGAPYDQTKTTVMLSRKHALTWMLGVQTGSWSRTGGTDKNSGHTTHTEDNADTWIRLRSSMHRWAYSGWRQQYESNLN
ncbi:hypothetical protein EDB84DRAFT_1445960 [Lactarius hengduanensis]|nr:hypothetical protein EDB84DRAFT_1445960 [Lactarius hengduanensis]